MFPFQVLCIANASIEGAVGAIIWFKPSIIEPRCSSRHPAESPIRWMKPLSAAQLQMAVLSILFRDSTSTTITHPIAYSLAVYHGLVAWHSLRNLISKKELKDIGVLALHGGFAAAFLAFTQGF